MPSNPMSTFNLGELLLKRRWWFVFLAILLIVTFETIEYMPHQEGYNIFFFFEVIFYGIVLPITTGIALSQLAARRTELAWSTYYLNLQHNLRIQLNNARSPEELASVLIHFFQVVMPLAGITVFTYDQRIKKYKLTLSWFQKEENRSPVSFPDCIAHDSPLLSDSTMERGIGLQPCHSLNSDTSSQNPLYYYLTYSLSDMPAGATIFYFRPNNSPSPEHARLLKEISPDITSVFKRIQLENLVQTRNDSINAEQQRIARDVHDSLGHSLAFMRLKLDQITMEYNLAETQNLRKEVETLRDIAKDAYDQMRDVLVALTPENDPKLNNIIQYLADRFQQRAGFKIVTRFQGQQRILPPIVRHHLFYISQEALTNIDKHARAEQVEINLRWNETCFEMTLADDGIGFDPAQPVLEGHRGLSNMYERAEESGAQLDIFSEIGCGTQIILRIPYEVEG